MAWSTTPIPPMRAEWTAFGVCTRGATAPPRPATRLASGGVATTSTRAEDSHGYGGATAQLEILANGSLSQRGSLCWCYCAALRYQRSPDDRLVLVHAAGGRNGDARRLDDVDGVDADARTDV